MTDASNVNIAQVKPVYSYSDCINSGRCNSNGSGHLQDNSDFNVPTAPTKAGPKKNKPHKGRLQYTRRKMEPVTVPLGLKVSAKGAEGIEHEQQRVALKRSGKKVKKNLADGDYGHNVSNTQNVYFDKNG